MNKLSEAEMVQIRYSRRKENIPAQNYNMLNTDVWQTVHDRQRNLIALLNKHAPANVNELKVLEIGCGSGGNILELLRLGFVSKNLTANELLLDRATNATENLPSAVNIIQGDAANLTFLPETFDIVYQSTMFSSLLDTEFQNTLANKMWKWVKPGGGILWYDFIYNNPNNTDVRAVTLNRIYQLFPESSIDVRRVTLAPPISRAVCKVHPSLYGLLNSIPLLRTHLMCWIGKSESAIK
jgi:SAM-dependent methyltransferase